MLIAAFVYCAHFTRGVVGEITNYHQNQYSGQIRSTECKDTSDSFSDTINQAAQIVSQRIEQAIRQTSHLIGL